MPIQRRKKQKRKRKELVSNGAYWLEITVYPDGRVCISILHAPGDDPNGYELASERWTPIQTVCYQGI